jgi:hypothetical protein
MKNIQAMLYGKPIQIGISSRADAELARRGAPLRVEMELYFSCLIGKTVRFDDATHGRHFEEAAPHLQIGFHAVQTQACSLDSLTTVKAPRVAFPIVRPERFVPKWLEVDFRNGQWSGIFGLVIEEGRRHAA